MGLGGPLKKSDDRKRSDRENITFDTMLLHLAPATSEYRNKNTYDRSTAKFIRVKGGDPVTQESAPASSGDGTATEADKAKASQETIKETMDENCKQS
jgi:hypothetical protein